MIKKIDDAIGSFCKWFLYIALGVMLFLTLLNICLRWFEISLLWIDPIVRHMVLFSTFLGGTLAIGDRIHIKIDILGRILKEKKLFGLEKVFDKIIIFITFISTMILLYASWNLFLVEKEFGTSSTLGLHSSVFLFIIPLGVSIMCVRLFLSIFIKVEQ